MDSLGTYPVGATPAVIAADNAQLAQNFDVKALRSAAKADEAEHVSTIREAFLTHRKAIMFSMLLSGALIMEGYDVVVIGSFYGHPAFLKRFGVPADTEIGYVIPAQWQSALSNGSSAGGIIGLLINGWAAERYGARPVMGVSLIALTCFIFIMVFANSLGMLVAGEVLCGLPWGVFQTLTTAYASEVCPIQLRGYLTAYVNLCWGVGILLSSGVVKATLPIPSDWSWRLPFVIQWVWILPLAAIVYYCPPSPWWLVRKGRLEEAKVTVKRLTNPKYFSEEDAQNTVAMMEHTTALEIEASAGASYIDCFRKTDRRRTEISMMIFAAQLLSGQNLIGQGVQFLQTAGIGTDLSFSLNMVLNSMFIIGTIVSWGLLSVFGRRTLYCYGMALMAVVELVVGIIAFKTSTSKAAVAYTIGSLLIALNFVYNATLGPLCYTIIGEVSSTRLRQKSIVLSRIAYQIMNIICGIVNPRMLSPTAWNLGAKSGVVWSVSAGLTTLYLFLRLPETKGRSYGELDLLFEHRVPAWRFKSTKVDQFAVENPEAYGMDPDAGLKEKDINSGAVLTHLE